MKKFLLFLLIPGLVFTMMACNTTADDTPTGGDETKEATLNPNNLYVLGNDTGYPGAEISLAGNDLVDISNYASVTVTAQLFSDVEGETPAVQGDAGDNLAQFTLLKKTGDWNGADNKCAPTKYNMSVDGPSSMTVPAGASGVPGVLLLQANWADFDGAVKSIFVKEIVFTPKTSDVRLDTIFGTSVSVSGNKITFKNAAYTAGTDGAWDGTAGVPHAALYIFDNEFFPLDNKTTLTFHYSLADYETSATVGGQEITLEHQIHIQAAQDETSKDKFNGRNTQPGQKYITLDDPNGGYNPATASGSFTVSVPDLLAAAAVSGSANDIKGPFTLDAVRIVNNGTRWDDAGTIHTRAKTYTLIIESVTIQ